MNIIQNRIAAAEGVKRLAELVRNGEMPVSLSRVADGAKPHLLRQIRELTDKNVICLASSDFAARQMFQAYSYDDRLFLPAQPTEIGIIETKSNDVLADRTAALAAMRDKPHTVFLSMDSMLYKMRPQETFYQKSILLRQGSCIEPKLLLEQFAMIGYERSSLVETKGHFSGRGEIVEVFTPNYEAPVRINFFDDEIESIRFFDEETQRSFGDELAEAEVFPALEICLDEQERMLVAEYLGEMQGGRREAAAGRFAYEVRELGYFPNIEAFTGLFRDSVNIFDYMQDCIVVCDGMAQIISDYEKKTADRNAMLSSVLAENGAFGCETGCYFDAQELIAENTQRFIDFEGVSQYFKGQQIDVGFVNTVGYLGNFEMLVSSMRDRIRAGWKINIFAGGRARSLSRALSDEGIEAPIVRENDENRVNIIASALTHGFEIPENKIVFLSESDLFGSARKKLTHKAKKRSEDILAELKPGDIVVHDLYGKGRFLGITKMEVGGVSADYIELEYRDGDKLYIQTAQIERVQKYIGPGSDDEGIKLSKLGSKEWDNQKAKARKSIKQLAEDLQSIYLERTKMKGFAYSADSMWQREFEDNFTHEETDGQIESIRQIKRDMQSTKIMDRLLLGDVGYGKTEVAMRACFKAVLDSKQVAVLVPTTLLARQHYETFRERFSGFPVRIEMLSRFTKKPEQIKKDLSAGAVDIIIGTHKLLSKSIEYKDLGLLIIDEEQRFGVSHKERIKDMKRSVDVLTLTATPIPRTLEMALTGIRDMSTIDTPPADRKEVQAYVAEFSWSLVREAVMKELARGGQIFFVCPRVGQMDELMRTLKMIVPEVNAVAVHGQMGENEFEEKVSRFIDHEYDLMLCTTIVESGIDIPAANTIIVYEADRFGLAQLYQLKGRVGRSSVRAYAYFLHSGMDHLSEVAAKRLSALKEFTQFGSGLKIAMKDLEIRGAGNILGPEQSGHMAQIGYSLYCKLVKDEVSALNSTLPVEIETSVELGMNAYIPMSYVAEEAQKIDMYRRIGAVKDLEEAKDVRAEFTERFGKPPAEVENLLSASVIRAYAEKACVASVIRKGMVIEVKFSEHAVIDVPRVMQILGRYREIAQYRRSSPPAILYKPKPGRLYSDLLKILSEISHCIYAEDKV